jgi:predicted metalloprotease with PDZ domain
MRRHLALAAIALGLAACTRTMESGSHRPCQPSRALRAANGVGVIGMSIDRRASSTGESEIVVDRIVPDGPAATAGIRPDDRILGIDGTPTRGFSIAEAARRLRGPADTSVALQVAHGGELRAVQVRRVAPGALWSASGRAHHVRNAAETEGVRASDVAPAEPGAAPPCR